MKAKFLVLCCLISGAVQADVRFSVKYPATSYAGAFSGRVVVYLSKRTAEPRFGPNWFAPEPIFSAKFMNVHPGEAMILGDSNTVAFPGKPSSVPAGEYHVQAVIDRNLGGRAIGGSPGNLFSKSVTLVIDPGLNKTIELDCTEVVVEQAFKDTDLVKEVRFQSPLLTKWYGRPTLMKAAVALPEEWKGGSRKLPVLYVVPGFGGTHEDFSGMSDTARITHKEGEPLIVVLLNPDCPTGHCAFADSANNGPWGTALTTELIPFIETKYSAMNQPAARFVNGHSSGGWSSLWLQVRYPKVFGGWLVHLARPRGLHPISTRRHLCPEVQPFPRRRTQTNSSGQVRGKARPVHQAFQ